ncbi:MAG: peptidase [Cyclobacteriaceae bacterium]
MTYCLAIRLKQGIVGIADTRITTGTETTNAKKLFTYEGDRSSLFLMTSGLRSVRDKALTYFSEVLNERQEEFDKMYKAVNACSEAIKQVAREDKRSLHEAGLHFNIHTLVGGQMSDDEVHKTFLIYPEGNWIEIGPATPFMIIGNSGFGKPLLNRSITYDSDMRFALKTGLLSFDSTRVSANDVGYPIDVFLYHTNSYHFVQRRYHEEELRDLSMIWAEILKRGIHEVPDDWMEEMFQRDSSHAG